MAFPAESWAVKLKRSHYFDFFLMLIASTIADI